MHQKISYTDPIKYGWNTTIKNWQLLVPLVFVYYLFQYFPKAVYPQGYERDLVLTVIGVIVSLLVVVLRLLMDIGFIRIALNFVENKKSTFSTAFEQTHLLWKFILGTLLYGAIVAVGFILLIIPGIYFALKYIYTPYYIVDKGLGPMEALKKSGQLTEGIKLKLLVFGLFLAGINILGAIFFLVGLLVTIPTTMIAQAYLFRKLDSGAKFE